MVIVLHHEIVKELGRKSAAVAWLVYLGARSLHLYVDEDLPFEEVEDLVKGWYLVALSGVELEELFVGPVVDEVLRVTVVLEIPIVTAMRDH